MMLGQALITAAYCAANVGGSAAFTFKNRSRTGTFISSPLRMVVEIGPTDDDVEPPLPGQMKVSEIKSELDLRKVSYNDCFDRDSLESRLNDARSSGKADPSIIDEFNKRNLEANVKGESFEVSDDMIENSVGGDGKYALTMSYAIYHTFHFVICDHPRALDLTLQSAICGVLLPGRYSTRRHAA